LCTDGITRHISDPELRNLLLQYDDLPKLCDELKRLCYERGAEDNLTAVIVCVGTPISSTYRTNDLEKTISPETTPVPSPTPAQTELGTGFDSTANFLPASRTAFPANQTKPVDESDTVEIQTPNVIENRLDVPAGPPPASGVERTMTRFFMFVLFLAVVAAAFYAGRRYKGTIPYVDQAPVAVTDASPTPVVGDDPVLKFERGRREVDNDPNAWLANQLKNELTRQGIQQPLDSNDAEFLYLYGRASLLIGNSEEALRAFDAAIAKANLPSPQANATLKKEAALGLAAVALNSEKDRPGAQARFDQTMRPAASPGSTPPLASPSLSP
jgi:protein phosphatase